ncbi:hypothetical protein [Desulfurispora thermophila]|uniref:hypothetical protein n=1 Tax=Desulfurispora thermophila TaxID=265470 RepID=UPI0012EA2344|nr:hypothetical protein [Desulfurispora thermophila]
MSGEEYMSRLHFTRRELTRAYKTHYETYLSLQEEKGGSTALLLFYAVECGLKAVWMKRKNCEETQKCPNVIDFSHDLNRILRELKVRPELLLPRGRVAKKQRTVDVKYLNQAFRYGYNIENQHNIIQGLLRIVDWMKGEI